MYPKISITTDAVIFAATEKGLAVLLIKRGNNPYKDQWALPGGFLDADETLKSSCRRELKEETGVEVGNLKRVGIYDKVNRDPRGRVITIAYTTKLDKPREAIGADDAKEARWVLLKEMGELAFDHDKIVEDALKSLSLK